MNDSESNNIFGRNKHEFIEINLQRSQPETYARGLENNYHLGVVDGARPGISRGENSRGSVAGDIAGDAGVGLNLGVDVGAHLNRALPELGDRRGDCIQHKIWVRTKARCQNTTGTGEE